MGMSDYPIFSVMGVEIEYMLVDKEHFNIQPQSDMLLRTPSGEQVEQINLGEISISNELVMHVIEFKNSSPKPINTPLSTQFHQALLEVQPKLLEHNLALMPTGAHPWMNPEKETVRWPHANKEIYQQYDAIFNCKGHGWSNLQSMHVNLPYTNEDEFYQLHSLIRILLPLLPALAASTPILDKQYTGLLDARLHYYNTNQSRIPSISGEIIPEFIRSELQYQEQILSPMYQDIHPFDPKGILQYPWLNSRGAIAKFDVKAIEIRIIDTQECTTSNIAIAKIIFAILKHWHDSTDYYLNHPCETRALKHLYDNTIRQGLSSPIESSDMYLQWQAPKGLATVRQIWAYLIEKNSSILTQEEQVALETILSAGNLSNRILKAIGPSMDMHKIKYTYSHLIHSLISDTVFKP